ncbi:MAG TPA: hypothetical protein K8V05_02220 [Butyricimonas virosa]|uniref:Uncharacterized protein n=1 Tax=Butyricimonas virosa TaxID=544645 RepID=A0A921H1D1_9BACT|nr:hypothetical protein [Butyricimonas virosa]
MDGCGVGYEGLLGIQNYGITIVLPWENVRCAEKVFMGRFKVLDVNLRGGKELVYVYSYLNSCIKP